MAHEAPDSQPPHVVQAVSRRKALTVEKCSRQVKQAVKYYGDTIALGCNHATPMTFGKIEVWFGSYNTLGRFYINKEPALGGLIGKRYIAWFPHDKGYSATPDHRRLLNELCVVLGVPFYCWGHNGQLWGMWRAYDGPTAQPIDVTDYTYIYKEKDNG